MSLNYCIPTYNSFARCVQAVNAVMANTKRPDQITLIDDSGTGASLGVIVPALQARADYSGFQMWVHERRCGVAASWNQFLRDSTTEFVLIANDDAMPHVGTIQRMLDATIEYPDELFFAGDGHSGTSFSFFMVRRAPFVEKIGWFDERFFPAYFEDNDMSRRITLAGYKHIFVSGATYDHVGSSTLHTYTRQEQQEHHEQFRTNENFFIYKWGGKPGKETYHIPFNGAHE